MDDQSDKWQILELHYTVREISLIQSNILHVYVVDLIFSAIFSSINSKQTKPLFFTGTISFTSHCSKRTNAIYKKLRTLWNQNIGISSTSQIYNTPFHHREAQMDGKSPESWWFMKTRSLPTREIYWKTPIARSKLSYIFSYLPVSEKKTWSCDLWTHFIGTAVCSHRSNLVRQVTNLNYQGVPTTVLPTIILSYFY